MSETYQISSTGLGWLGLAFQEKNSISPFVLLEKDKADFNDSVKEALLVGNIITSDGTITPDILPALQILANAEAYTRIRILGVDAPVDKITYFKNGMSCSVDSGPTDFTITYPAMSQEAGYVMEEFSGSSRVVNVSFQTTLTVKATQVFLSLLDLSRAEALCILAGRTGANAFTVEEIIKKQEEGTSYLWLNRTLKNLIGDSSLSAGDTDGALQELIGLHYVEQEGNKYSLSKHTYELAMSMLIPNYVFHITSATMISSSQAKQSECYAVFCGMHDILYIDQDAKGVTIETISGSNLYQILRKVLTSPLEI